MLLSTGEGVGTLVDSIGDMTYVVGPAKSSLKRTSIATIKLDLSKLP